jgi:hypothetical protein
MTAMRIDYTITADMPDGQALPPFMDESVVWHVVRRLPGGSTLWRSISIRASARPPASRETFGGISKDQNP